MQGDPFKIGKVVPIGDGKFECLDQFAYIKDAVTSPGSGITVTTASDKPPTSTVLDLRAAPMAVAIGNVLLLGPSNHADNPGATEEVKVTAVDATSFTADVLNKYAAGDQITVRTVPLGWTPDATVVTGKLFECVENKLLGVTGNLDTGNAVKISRGASYTLTANKKYDLNIQAPTTVNAAAQYVYKNTPGSQWRKVLIDFNFSALTGSTALSATLAIRSYVPAQGLMKLSYIKKDWAISGDSPSWNNYDNGTGWDTAGAAGANDIGAAAADIAITQTPGDPEWFTFTLLQAAIQELIDGTAYGLLIHTTMADVQFTLLDNLSDFVLTVLCTDASNTTHQFSRTTNINSVLNSNGTHRIAGYVKNTGTYGSCGFEVEQQTAGGAFISTANYTHTAAMSTFTEFSHYFTPSPTCSKIKLYNVIKNTIAAATTLTVGNIVLTHAKGTDDTSAGVYTFDDYPVNKSLDYGYYSGRKKISLVNNTVSYSDASDGRVRWWLTCAFTWGSRALYDNLLTLLGLIAHDGKLALFPSIDNLPPVIIGELTITPFKRQSTDLTPTWFTLTFEGC